MSNVNGSLNMHIKKWHILTKRIKECYEELTEAEQSAFDVLSDYWRNNNFNKEECSDCIQVIKKDAPKHGNNIKLKADLQGFRELCSRYYTKTEEEYKSFQKTMGGIPRQNISVPTPTVTNETPVDSNSGYGRITQENGDYYLGERMNGNKHGHGKFFYSDGSWCEGEFINDGFTCSNGRTYNAPNQRHDYGEFNNWNRVGSGRMEWSDGMWSEGEWNNDGMCGLGEAYYPNWSSGHFKGRFSANDICNGRIEWPNGDWYEGEFKNGTMNGEGTLYSKSKNRTSRGVFIDGSCSGVCDIWLQKILKTARPILSRKIIITTIILMGLCIIATIPGIISGAFLFESSLPVNFFEYEGLLWIVMAPFALYGGYVGLTGSVSDFFNKDVREIETTTYSDGRKVSRDTGNGCFYQLFAIVAAPIICGALFSAIVYYIIYLLVSLLSVVLPYFILLLMILCNIFIPRKLFSMGKEYSIYLMITLCFLSFSAFGAISAYSLSFYSNPTKYIENTTTKEAVTGTDAKSINKAKTPKAKVPSNKVKKEAIKPKKKAVVSKEPVPHYTDPLSGAKGNGIKVAGIWWAPMNVGASSANDYGYQFKFGSNSGVLHGSSLSGFTAGNWNEGAQGPCPDGWYVPTLAQLTKLKNAKIATWDTNKKRIVFTGGLIAPAAGFLENNSWYTQGSYFTWGSSTASTTNAGEYWYLYNRGGTNRITLNDWNKNRNATSIRCVTNKAKKPKNNAEKEAEARKNTEAQKQAAKRKAEDAKQKAATDELAAKRKAEAEIKNAKSHSIRIGNILVSDRNVGATQGDIALNYTNDRNHADNNNFPFKGGYYTWKEALTICPNGWRLPTEKEMNVISNAMQFSDGKAYIQDNGGNRCYFPLSGYSSMSAYTYGYYWSSTSYSSRSSSAWSMSVRGSSKMGIDMVKSDKLSVRCIKTAQ